jgi:Flp pilus assembly protein TadG
MMRLPKIGRRGIAASEFAVLAPVLILLLLGVHDVANSFYTSIQLESAVRVGAQQAIATPGNLDAMRNAIIAAAPGLTTADVPLPAVSCECQGVVAPCGGTCSAGEARYVTLTARRDLTPLLFSSFSSGSGHAVVRLR